MDRPRAARLLLQEFSQGSPAAQEVPRNCASKNFSQGGQQTFGHNMGRAVAPPTILARLRQTCGPEGRRTVAPQRSQGGPADFWSREGARSCTLLD